MKFTLNELMDKTVSCYIQSEGTLRLGQSYMNVLSTLDKDLYDEITGSNIDPFYDDMKITPFLNHIELCIGHAADNAIKKFAAIEESSAVREYLSNAATQARKEGSGKSIEERQELEEAFVERVKTDFQNRTLFEGMSEIETLRTLVDAAYDLVEIFKTDDSPYNTRWKKDWLAKARELGAQPSP